MNPRTGAGLDAMKGGIDLNGERRFWSLPVFLSEAAMKIGKTLCAQLMDVLPGRPHSHRRSTWWRPLREAACLYRAIPGDGLCATDLPRESARHGMEGCLSAQAATRYHMGCRHEITRSTLADANEMRDWRIHAKFAQGLIVQARKLCLGDRRLIRAPIGRQHAQRPAPRLGRCLPQCAGSSGPRVNQSRQRRRQR
jgi:hypothetical protein